MGASTSVINRSKSSMRSFVEDWTSYEVSKQQLGLEDHLVEYPEVREKFAQFVRNRGAADEAVCSKILGINARYMAELVFQDTLQEHQNYDNAVILYYIPMFAKAKAYEKFVRDVIITPPLSRCASEEDLPQDH